MPGSASKRDPCRQAVSKHAQRHPKHHPLALSARTRAPVTPIPHLPGRCTESDPMSAQASETPSDASLALPRGSRGAPPPPDSLALRSLVESRTGHARGGTSGVAARLPSAAAASAPTEPSVPKGRPRGAMRKEALWPPSPRSPPPYPHLPHDLCVRRRLSSRRAPRT